MLNRIGATWMGGVEFHVSMRRDAAEEPEALRRLQEGAIGHPGRILAQQPRTATLPAGR
ncbi:hypothetical protein LRS73_17820 [Methylobacterium currus]|uniref:hypothetical protein n=1 Tax=Methylobacterium currus TaxID=2051553 RepID=UPI0013DEF77B|nr:hypothetical protein [Methylobacterium currus]UHC14415.1 hypothetical protein LRS73_17820 [Methylobacterium currus]